MELLVLIPGMYYKNQIRNTVAYGKYSIFINAYYFKVSYKAIEVVNRNSKNRNKNHIFYYTMLITNRHKGIFQTHLKCT